MNILILEMTETADRNVARARKICDVLGTSGNRIRDKKYSRKQIANDLDCAYELMRDAILPALEQHQMEMTTAAATPAILSFVKILTDQARTLEQEKARAMELQRLVGSLEEKIAELQP